MREGEEGKPRRWNNRKRSAPPRQSGWGQSRTHARVGGAAKP